MLITFFLWHEHFFGKSGIIFVLYFKRHQEIYYEKLTAYHNGNVVAWVDFFLDGIIEIANGSGFDGR